MSRIHNTQRLTTKNKKTAATERLTVCLEVQAKQVLERAAELRHIKVEEYIRQVHIPQAINEVAAAEKNIIQLSAVEQLQFWNALHEPVKLTTKQKKLAKIMRSEAL